MSFKFACALPAGNAVQLLLTPPNDVTAFRLLRRTTGEFTGPDDPDAWLVADCAWLAGDAPETSVLDRSGLVNGTAYAYRVYYDADEARYDDITVTPAATYQDGGQDVLALLLDRLTLGLAVEVTRGTLHPKSGVIGVQNAPPLWDATTFPVVTLQLAQASLEERGLGEVLAPDVETETEFVDGEGALARVSVTLVGWSLNPDERRALRRALRRILNANLPVFDDAGFLLIEWTQRDQEDMQSYNVPIYQVVTEFRCLAPEWIESAVDKVEDVVPVALIDGDPA